MFMQCYKKSTSNDIFKMLDVNLDDTIDSDELNKAWDLYLHPKVSAKSHFGHRVNTFYNRFKHDSMDHIDMSKLLSAGDSQVELYEDFVQTPALDFILGDLVPVREPKQSDEQSDGQK